MKQPAVYLLCSKPNGTLYIGVTSNLVQRIWQHREGVVEGFTRRYGLKTLVWYEQHETMQSAISREKALKKWNRSWKLRLVAERNPQWLDLWPEITGQESGFSGTPSFREASGAPLSRNDSGGSSFPSAFIGNPRSPLDSRLRGNDGIIEVDEQ
ncbi:MAG: GIY-YIG nuclease family protein [Gammaproteobacteria bacterium]|nr:GIY-YIG nuclease family protein [Gammaproteobacteria bacterium]